MSTDPRPTPLAGLKVLDFGQFIAIPFCTLWLSWLGAEVIVVESRRRMTSRTAPPYAEGLKGDPNASGYFNSLYSGKKSCTVDMTTAAGREVVRRLASKVDVMVDNYSTGVLEKLGIGYDVLSKLNPKLVMLSNGAFGRYGPMRNARGLHSAVNLFSGVADVTGYAGGEPRLLGGCIPDPLSGTYSGFALMAAIRHCRRTGHGQFIDVAMYEAMMTLIPEAVIDYSMNGHEPERIGNRDIARAPHGIFRCRDDDSWIALSVHSDEEWAAMCAAIGKADWADDASLRNVAGRIEHVHRLELALEAWTRSVALKDAVDLLQSAGIAAAPVLRNDELLHDEQLIERGLVVTIDHPIVGPRRQLGLPWRMDSFGIDYRRAPLLGEHTREILTGLAGVSDAEYDQLDADGVLA